MSTPESDTPPDQRAFEADANRPSFLAGVYRGDWKIESVDWPTVQVTISAPARANGPDSFALRCDFTNYPTDAPTATPWDPETDTKLAGDKRPRGEDIGMVFRTSWEEGRALYAAYDRVALAGHPNWVTEHPWTTWTGRQDLTWWVQRIWDLLNSDGYEGT